MKVCPHCGFVDGSHWRQNRWRTQVEFLWLTEFREEKPELAMDLEKGKPFVFDEHYAYQLSGKGNQIVERAWIKLFEWGGKSAFHVPAERVKHRLKDIFQTRLSVEPQHKEASA